MAPLRVSTSKYSTGPIGRHDALGQRELVLRSDFGKHHEFV
jgi:hypothetical protein